MYKRPKNNLTENELHRLYEVLFYMIIENLNKIYKDAAATWDFITVCSQLFKCNIIVIQKYYSRIIGADYMYCPSRNEVMQLLYEANFSIRYITKTLAINNQVFYNVIRKEDKYIQQPVSSEDEYNVIKKFVEQFDQLKEVF